MVEANNTTHYNIKKYFNFFYFTLKNDVTKNFYRKQYNK